MEWLTDHHPDVQQERLTDHHPDVQQEWLTDHHPDVQQEWLTDHHPDELELTGRHKCNFYLLLLPLLSQSE